MRRVLIYVAIALVLLLSIAGWALWRRVPAPKNVRREIERPKETILATYENTFRCTLYYSPREAGFTQEGGFDLTPETKPGLEERVFPKDFLRAVELEGFGRLKAPIGDKAYIRHGSGKWGFANQPVDAHDRPLIPKQTCAIARPHNLVAPNAMLSIRCRGVPVEFDRLRWRVSDSGSGLEPRQLDLYWGEDDPLGPGRKLSKPKGFEGDLLNPTIMVVAGMK